MNIDYSAPDVVVGSKWWAWEQHLEVVERWEQAANVAGAPPRIPYVRLAALNSDGTVNKQKKRLPIEAWRVSYYGTPSVAFA
jgi:hypothetical protein